MSEDEGVDKNKAREEAQARRERILHGADDRLDLATGLLSPPEESKGASKLAAMRRKRFKKKSEGGEEGATTTTSSDAAAATASSPTKNNNNDSAPVVEKQVPKSEPELKQEKPKSVVKTEQQPKPTEKEAAEEDVIEEINTPGVERDEKKKYMGVAKMRRKMVLEQKKQKEAEVATAAATHKVNLPAKTALAIVDRMAILMHVLIVVLLFAAGLDVGLQGNLDYNPADLPQIVRTGPLAPRELKFLNLLPKSLRPVLEPEPATNSMNLLKEEHTLVVEQQEELEYHVNESDEFEEVEKKPVARGVDQDQQNLDPLFGVDLDKYTAGSGIVFMLARFAVKVHRLNLAVLYYGPRKVLFRIVALCRSLVTLPPILAIIAMVLRQLVGNILLNAHLPVRVEDDNQSNDIVSTIFATVKKVLANSFRPAIGFYRTWTHLRTDMYIVACGLLVGLAWTHTHLVGPTSTVGGTTKTSTSDEL